MKSTAPEQFRLSPEQAARIGLPAHLGTDESYGMNGMFIVRHGRDVLRVIASDGADADGEVGRWEHVSVSLPNRCPTWEEMCAVKALFFDEHETVMQLHPPKSEYVNNHQFCLHLWRPKGATIPLPPSILVGIKGVRIA